MKNNIVLSAVVAAGLMAGAVMAPAQAEEQEPLPVLPCVDFTTGFMSELSSPVGEVVEQKSDGPVFTGLVEIADSDFPTEGFLTALPTLRIGVPEPTELVPSVWIDYREGYDEPVLGCDYGNPVVIDYTWLSRSDGFEAKVEEGKNVSIPSWGCAEGADACRQMSMRSVDPGSAIPESWIEFSPVVTIEDYGQYVNVGEFSMAFDPPWTTQKQAKTTQVSYTLNVLPPDTSSQLPEVPNEPAGISEGYDFGNVEIFDYKRGNVKITNIGTEDLRVNKAKIVDGDGNDAPEFSVTDNNCNQLIAPGGSCKAQVQFFPREQGARAAFINVTTNSPHPLQIPLNGVGTYTEPESVVEAEKEAEETGEPPVYEVAKPEKPTVPNTGGNKPNGDHDGDGVPNKKDPDYKPNGDHDGDGIPNKNDSDYGDKGQEVTQKKNGTYVVKTKSKKIKLQWKAPETDQPVTGYEIRSKFKKKSWKKWKDVDPMPDENGWIKASVKAKKSGNYKVQIAASTPWVKRGFKATEKIKKK